MGVEQPWMYDHPTKYSFIGPSDKGFNPKAATHASWTPPQPRSKHYGPLIDSQDFNRHPDSYFVVPYGNLNAKPMSPGIKSRVKWTRMAQLILRICALIGALGLLFCVICIKSTDAFSGWIIRVPPAVAILHTLYAIYHLARSSKGRTPTSSASYMLFAAIIDVSLVPFFVYTAMVAQTESTEPSNTDGHWSTLFGTSPATHDIIYATFLLSIVDGALHLVSLALSLYLGVIFRQISRLPPDMNPLEDNLTSRHKHKRSDMTDNHMSKTSMTTTTTSNRDSTRADDPLISPVRSVPFMHTRKDSHSNISPVPTPNFSPRSSRIDVAQRSQSQAPSQRTSRTHFPDLNMQPTLPNLVPQNEPLEPQLKRSPTKTSSVYSRATNSPRPPSTVPSLPALADNNWITHPTPSPSPSPSRELTFLRNKNSYQPLVQSAPFEYADENQPPLLPRPLEMNPPSSKVNSLRLTGSEARPLAPSTGNLAGPGFVGISKARQFGSQGRPNRDNGGGRVVSRSGVEIREGGILPSGGVRAREVSGKVMEEGRGGGGGGGLW